MVTSINGNNVTWRDDKTGELVTDPHRDLEILMAKGGKIRKRTKPKPLSFQPPLKKKSVGGMLVGPSHELGGIPALVDGTEPIEVEGGEFVVNAKTVDAVGEDFLHKLNHTSTPYHDPATGFSQGQLPTPSLFKQGGQFPEKKQKKIFQNGGRSTKNNKRIAAHTVRERQKPCPPGYYKSGPYDACFQMNGTPTITNKLEAKAQILRAGGSLSKQKKLQEGGNVSELANSDLGTDNTIQESNAEKNRRKRRLETYRTANYNYNIVRPTPKSIGKNSHSHTMNLDIENNGVTTGGIDHEHTIKDGEVQMTCSEVNGCHSHN